MPHNPRRQRGAEPDHAGLTPERIADALERAVALRRRTAVDPADVRAIPLTPSEATRSTRRQCVPAPWDPPEERDPWVLVGWVVHRRDRGAGDGRWWDRYDRAWDVRLNVEDGRVWLKPSRWGHRPKGDPYP